MIKEAIDRILQLARLEVVEHDGFPYARKGNGDIVMLPEPDMANPFGVATLTGLVDYLKSGLDDKSTVGLSQSIVQVCSPTEVGVVSSLRGRDSRRHRFAVAEYETSVFPFGRFIDLEEFNIRMQSMFVMTDTAKNILNLTSGITDSMVSSFDDDGTRQEVTVKAGIERKCKTAVPNPVRLQPYRTFPEIEQPESQFILRLKRGEGAPPSVALIDAGADQWKMDAMSRIKTWLVEQLEGRFPVIM